MRTRLAILFLVGFGGVAALSWEVVWQLQASLAFGISAFGTALTLAATMGGMAVGSLAMGRVLHRRTVARPFVLYGWLELIIGISGLLMLPGFALLEQLDAQVWAMSPAFAPAFRVIGIAVLLGPPTISMGATIPTFQLVARRYGTSVAKLYALNTAGAAGGVLLFSFVLLPALGVGQTCTLIAAVNAVVFVSTWVVTSFAADDTPSPAAASEAAGPARSLTTPRLSPRMAQVIVLGTGFATFGLEVAWFRALRSAFWSTSHTFAIILASVLIPLAIGARLVPWIRRRGVTPGATVAAAGAAILVATPLVERMDLFAAALGGTYFGALATWLGLTLAIVGPPMALLGMALPWCLEEFPEPRQTGRLYGINTLGSVLGSIAAAWLLLPWLGFARCAWLIGAAMIVLALPALAGGRRFAVAAGLVTFAAAWYFTSSPGRDRFQGFPDFAGHEVLAFREAPDSTVSVIKAPRGNRALMIDGFAASTEGLFAAHYMRWMGSLPMLAHPRPEDGLVICFGTGQTTDGVREEGIAALDVVDVSGAVFEMAPLFETNNGVLDAPHVNPVVMDGRAWLRRTNRRYDVITLEPMPPNFAGVNSLYSREFYEIAASRLKPGGIVAQWLPFHLVEREHSVAIAATFLAVFPDSVLWVDPIGGTGILLGRFGGGTGRLGERWPGVWREAVSRTLSEDEIRLAVTLDPAGLQRYADGGVVITDDNQMLNFGQLHSVRLDGEHSARLDTVNREDVTRAAGRVPFRIERPEVWRRR
ncbi:MAG: hypothetical protein GY715_14830 [Planctomycetes bacterium]|nr:hypothetical protein [Planctomycetota bacterium]